MTNMTTAEEKAFKTKTISGAAADVRNRHKDKAKARQKSFEGALEVGSVRRLIGTQGSEADLVARSKIRVTSLEDKKKNDQMIREAGHRTRRFLNAVGIAMSTRGVSTAEMDAAKDRAIREYEAAESAKENMSREVKANPAVVKAYGDINAEVLRNPGLGLKNIDFP